MPINFFYVYALKDCRQSPAMPFYIGKGTGSRAYEHLITPDKTRKYSRIQEIIRSGGKVDVDVLVDDITESQALRIEAELIAAFGTEDTGGPLTNSVIPSGFRKGGRKGLIVSHGAIESAQIGLELLKASILKLAKANPHGITNADAFSALGLRSDYRGKQKNYLTYSVLGLLLREGKMIREGSLHKANV